MRTIILISIFLLGTLSYKAQDASTKTATLIVSGNCEQCQTRIENAADIKGVKIASWSSKSKILSVTYNSDKVTIEQIEAAIVAKGHDIGAMKATEASYNKLPNCCRYRDKKCDVK